MKLRLKPVLSLVLLIAAELAAAGCNHTKPRSDAEISGEIQAKVSADQALQNKQIGVQAANGVVTLSGSVASENERSAAAADAASVAGVRTVVNNLSVTQPQPLPEAAAIQPPAAEPEEYAPETRTRDRQERYTRAHERTTKPTAAAVRQPKPASTQVSQRPAAQPRTVAMAQRSSDSQQSYEPQQSNQPQQSQSYDQQQGYDNQQGYDQQQQGNAPPPDAGQQGYAPPPRAAQPAYPPAREPRRSAMVTVPAGTSISIRMVDSVDSETAQVGDTFRATLNAPIELEGGTVVPADADVVGRVVEVQSAGRFKGAALLTIELTRLRYNGQSYAITTAPWTKEIKGRGKGTAAKVGGGAALGAIIGGIAGGGKGAAIGTVVGGGAGATAQGVTKQKQITLEPETLLSFRLDQSVTVRPASVNERARGRERLE